MSTNPNTNIDAEQAVGARWKEIPYQTVKHTAEICGCSRSRIYELLNKGALTAVTLAGKSLVTTESIAAWLATAKPRIPDRARVARAVEARLGRKPVGRAQHAGP
jgi:hypothetical protein